MPARYCVCGDREYHHQKKYFSAVKAKGFYYEKCLVEKCNCQNYEFDFQRYRKEDINQVQKKQGQSAS